MPETLRDKFYDIPYKASAEWNDKKRYNFDNSFDDAYKLIANQLSAQTKTDPDGFVENVYRGLLNHLTRNEEGVEMVILDPSSKKAFSELEFGKDFEEALRQLQLVVEFRQGEGYSLSVYGLPKTELASKFIPKKQGEPTRLIDLRSQYDNRTNAVRNRINMGPLLKKIADIENYLEKNPEDTIPQPVAIPQPSTSVPAPSAVQPVPAPVPASIQNQNKQIGAKIPMGSEPPTGV